MIGASALVMVVFMSGLRRIDALLASGIQFSSARVDVVLGAGGDGLPRVVVPVRRRVHGVVVETFVDVPEGELFVGRERLHMAVGRGVLRRAAVDFADWCVAADLSAARRRGAVRGARVVRFLRQTGWNGRGEPEPGSAEFEAIADMYEEASLCGMEVDHVFPLNGKRVSGLHVRSNLLMVSRAWNNAKRNRWPCRLRKVLR